MNLSHFGLVLLAVALPLVGVLAVGAWLARRGIERVRLVDREGRSLAEVVIGAPPAEGP